jgi:hypothetical protein
LLNDEDEEDDGFGDFGEEKNGHPQTEEKKIEDHVEEKEEKQPSEEEWGAFDENS